MARFPRDIVHHTTMKNTLLYLAFVVAGGATVVAFASGATWAGILSAAAGLLALGAVFTGRDTE